jgi:predicted DNA-binding ribbon-helix-helix protein
MATIVNQFLQGLSNLSYRLRRRCFMIDGHAHHVKVSEECWCALQDICGYEGISLQQLVEQVAQNGCQRSLSVELDLFAIAYFQAACAPNSMHQIIPANFLPC